MEDPIYVAFAKDPVRAARFAEGMSSFTTGPGYETHHIVDYTIWTSIPGGVVVDVDGSHGDFMVAVAQKYPSFEFIVQDLPGTIASSPELPLGLGNRVTFMSHDFFTEQPVKNADVYFFRWIFHNWSDEYSLRIQVS